MGDIACTSFFPAKQLGCYGDGGMCFANSKELEDLMRSYLVHGGGKDKYDNVRIGINGRLDSLQAAILLAKFEIFPDEIEKRQTVAAKYNELIKNLTVNIFLYFPFPDFSALLGVFVFFNFNFIQFNSRKMFIFKSCNEG